MKGDVTNNIRHWRKARRMTQLQVAELCGTSVGMISDLERGSRQLNERWIRELAAALDVSLASILKDHALPRTELEEEFALLRRYDQMNEHQRSQIRAMFDIIAPQIEGGPSQNRNSLK